MSNGYFSIPTRKASFEDKSGPQIELIEGALDDLSNDSQIHCDSERGFIMGKTKFAKPPPALNGLDFSNIIFDTSKRTVLTPKRSTV